MPAGKSILHYWQKLTRFYRVQADDMDLVRAQFDAFVGQLPLLYAFLAIHIASVTYIFAKFGHAVLTRIVPALLCTIAVVRGVWWWRRRYFHFTNKQIRHHLHVTSALAVGMAAGFVVWALLLYPLGDSNARAHLTFFLALTQIACVFCLMPLRPAAFGVATVGMLPFVIFFAFVDGGNMRIEGGMMTLISVGLLGLLSKYNDSFAALIRSRRDLSLRQIETQRLSDDNRRIALTDALSGLPNRRALLARLDEVAARQPCPPGTLGITFIDLDGFKDVNDEYGHQMGDAVIRKVSRMLAGMCPQGSMLARTGGDEFAIFLDCDSAEARASKLADEVLRHLAKPMRIEDHTLQIGASMGAAVDQDGTTNPYELLRRADTAMYRVKENGKSGFEIYDPSFDAKRLWRQTVEAEIRQGLERDEFEVFYQPVIDARTGDIVCVEALVRWPRRPGGALAPDDFIEIAETSGLIQPLGLFVLRRACTDLLRYDWLKLALNISPAQFRHPDFEVHLARVLRETMFPPERLQFEITEAYLIDHPERAALAITAFKSLGVCLALDDFGTGYTSVAYLQAYGFDIVKFHKSLSNRLGVDSKASLLIAGMVHIANALDMRVIAVGVETEAQATLLRIAGCHELQGFLFGQPEPLAKLAARQHGHAGHSGNPLSGQTG